MKDLTEIHEIKGKRFLLKVETSHEYLDYQKYEDLRFEIWEEPNDQMPGPRNMVCENYFNDGSALFIAVYVAGQDGEFIEEDEFFVGFSYGFLGVKDKEIGFCDPENLVYYSQYTGVKKKYLEFGLGILIKEFQRKSIMEIFGVFTISCTYDPLTGVNAYRNIHYFGMEVIDYKVAHYGEFSGRLNRIDVPCDRFYVYWYLDQENKRPEYDINELFEKEQLVLSSGTREFKGKNGSITLEIPIDLNMKIDTDVVLLEIPYDFYTILRETDVTDKAIRNLPIEWREKTRVAFLGLFDRGYKVVDFYPFKWEGRKRDFYILKK